MFTLVRRIHLYASVVLMSFVLMYFVSGFVMIHEDWFPRAPSATTTRNETLTYTAADLPDSDPLAATAFIQEKFDLTGQRNARQPAPGKPGGAWRFNFSHPGEAYQVVVTPKKSATTGPATQPGTLTAAVVITRNEFGVAGKLNAFHRLRGFGVGWKYNLWSIMYDAAAVSLILFSLSGIYLWYKLSKIKWPGVVVLSIGFGFTVGTYAYLALAK